MKPKGYLAMILIAGIGIAAMAMYAPIKAAPGEVKLESWELPLAELQSELATMRKVLDSLGSQLKQLDGDHAGFREDLDSAGHRLDALESALENFSPPGPAARHDATSDGSDAQPVWFTSQREAFDESAATGKPVLVLFSMPHNQCPPCKQLEEITLTERQVIQSLSRYVLLKVPHTDAARWGVTGFPTIGVYRPNKHRHSIWSAAWLSADSIINRLEDLP